MFIYFLIALVATTLGAISGLGGGVIIKPLVDLLNDYNAETINVLSSITVLTMAIVAVSKQIHKKTQIEAEPVIHLSVGSVLGGITGQFFLNGLIMLVPSNQMVTLIQNSLLGLIIIAVFIYMKIKDSVKKQNLTGFLPYFCAGLFLGNCSTFLGIGGGPINVALIIYLFSIGTKQATVYSIIIILFSQVAKLTSILFSSGFGKYDLKMLPFMMVGGVLGGFLGAVFSKKLNERAVEKVFNLVQLLVMAICCYNIINVFAKG